MIGSNHRQFQFLDPYQSWLEPRPSRTRRVALVLLPVVMLVWTAWTSGVIYPRLVLNAPTAFGVNSDSSTIFYEITVRNSGLLPVTIVSAGRDGAGLRLASVSQSLPVTVDPSGTISVRFTYQITDCDTVTSDPWPIPLVVNRVWGRQIINVSLPTQLNQAETQARSAPAEERQPLPLVARAGQVEWQRNQADLACALRRWLTAISTTPPA